MLRVHDMLELAHCTGARKKKQKTHTTRHIRVCLISCMCAVLWYFVFCIVPRSHPSINVKHTHTVWWNHSAIANWPPFRSPQTHNINDTHCFAVVSSSVRLFAYVLHILQKVARVYKIDTPARSTRSYGWRIYWSRIVCGTLRIFRPASGERVRFRTFGPIVGGE